MRSKLSYNYINPKGWITYCLNFILQFIKNQILNT